MLLLLWSVFAVLTSMYYQFQCLDFNNTKLPTVGVSVLIRNKAHSLPYFLTCIDKQDYPKDRMYLWLFSDNNLDNSNEVVELWIQHNKQKYNSVNFFRNDTLGQWNEDITSSPSRWSLSRFRHIIKLREKAMVAAKQKWADYHLMIDADVYLTNPSVLRKLVAKELTVVAPMLHSEGLYSNYWSAMNEKKYYKRSPEYLKIRERETLGCFDVPMIHSAVLINMNDPKSDYLTYDDRNVIGYDGPIDDIIIFALSASVADVKLKVCNEELWGYIQVPLDPGDKIKKDVEQLINVKMLALCEGHELPVSPELASVVTYPEPKKLGLNEIYMINLERRQNRREYMMKCFKELGLDYKVFNAVDGLNINMDNLPYGIKLMPGYEDPYHNRPMKAGEVGCFLSHYFLWKEMVDKKYKRIMVLEDDVYFRPYFRLNIRRLLLHLDQVDWNLAYIGRKIMRQDEPKASDFLLYPSYTYWTIGYILNLEGARKLLAAKPLQNMLPVDEFLPIMFDQHPNDTWKSYFPERNLIAVSAFPLLIEPMRYINQPGYVSDTEAVFMIDYETGTISHTYEAGYEYIEAEESVESPEIPIKTRLEL